MDLSVLIPARQEEWLDKTIEECLNCIEGNTEIIAILDGYIPNPPLTVTDPRVTLIYNPQSKGQRAATNQAAKLAKGKYLMKLDAHCALDQGFDVKMIQAFKEVGDNVTMIPLMRNLHVFDWVCPNGHRRYQGRSGPCKDCGAKEKKEIVWIAKPSPQSTAFRFDKTMHFQYHRDYSQTIQGAREYRDGLITGYNLSLDTRSVSLEIINLLTSLTNSHQLTSSSDSLWFRQNVSVDTMSFSPINNRGGVRTGEIFSVGDKIQMGRVTASPIFTEVVENGNISTSTTRNRSNEPSVEEAMCQLILSEIGTSSISSFLTPSEPIPAPGSTINSELIEKFNSILGREFVYNEKTSKFHNGSVTLSPIYSKELNETMSIQGSCFMLTAEKYFELDICSEDFHSWGQQGVEVACKTWLSGGRVLVNRKTWYAHMFRTQGGDFSFPYDNPQSKVNENREKSRELFQKDKWPKATRKFQWLLDHFNPPDWQLTKGIIYYTDNCLDEKIAKPVRDKLLQISQEDHIPIVSASLKKLDFGVKNIRFPSLKRGYLAMFKQILGALENSRSDIIFFTEHDVLYHPTHFDFEPLDKETFYYNQNVWYVRSDGLALHYDVNQLSGLCGYRESLITHFKERLARIEKEGFSRQMGFEPFTHHRIQWENIFKSSTWKSQFPNIDLRFGVNSTGMRWRKDQYRNQQLLINWQESTIDKIPGWDLKSIYNFIIPK